MINHVSIAVKIALALLIVVFFYYWIAMIFSKKRTHALCNYIGLSVISSKDMTFITVASLFVGYFFKEFSDFSRSFLIFGFTAPLIGCINILINRPRARSFIAGIPFLGDYMTCPLATDEKVQKIRQTMRANGIDDSEIEIIQKCTLTCEHCRGVDAIKIISTWSFTRVLIPWVFKSFNLF